MQKKFVIIGGDAAGMSAASKIRRLQPNAELVVFEKGHHISFAACGLPYWLGGVIKDGSKLEVLTPEIAREKRGIDVRTQHEVINIDVATNTVTVANHSNGETFTEVYDKLLIATGARAIIPPIPGIASQGIFTLRSLADGQKIHSYVDEHKVSHATIVGAGYVGLEMAEAFRNLNIDVTMVEMMNQVAPTFDGDMLDKLTEHVQEQGVDLRLGTHVNEFSSNDDKIIVHTSGGDLKTDLVLVSTGVQPNSEIAREAGISVGASGAISVNKSMLTNIENIYAAGDCIEHNHLVLNEDVWIPLATSANKGGRIAGENMAGGANRFPGVLGTAVVKVFDYTLAQTGLTEKQAVQSAKFGEIESTLITAGSKAHYYPGSTPITVKLITEKTSKRLLGAQMVSRSDISKRMDVLATAITARMTVEDIALLDLTYAPPVAPVYDPIHVAASVASK